MLRDLDPHHNRYAAIAILIDDYGEDLDDIRGCRRQGQVICGLVIPLASAVHRHHPVHPVFHDLEVPPRDLPGSPARCAPPINS